MVNSSCQSSENQSSRTPFIFDGTDFSNWKLEMEFYLKSVDIKCWDTVINGYDMVNRNDIGFNSRAIHTLYSYIDDVQYNLISHCLTA